MNNYDYKQYTSCIKIKRTPMVDLYVKAAKEYRECVRHKFNQTFWDNPYRPYRRGKNRCERCGLKI